MRIFHAFIRWLTGEKPPCAHEWRPCCLNLVGMNELAPGRTCSKCTAWEFLSDADFYAQFGERFYAAAKSA